MRHGTTAVLCAVLLLAVAASGGPARVTGRSGGRGAVAAPAAGHVSGRRWDDGATARWWTPNRMAAAVNVSVSPAGAARRNAVTWPAPTGRGRYFAGMPSVGVLFATGRGMRAHTCTAAVVHSTHADVIITAAHCGGGTRRAFVPGYDGSRGAVHAPYGIWAVAGAWRPAGFTQRGAGSDLDVAFLRLRRDARGRGVEGLTGGNRLLRAWGWVHRVTVVGYPAAGPHNPADRALRCAGTTARLAGRHQMRFTCHGFYGGTSGAPWFTRVDPRTGTGDVIGVIGGENGGGPRYGTERVSYSPLLGLAAFSAYRSAGAA